MGISSSFTSSSLTTFLSILAATYPHGSNLDLISTRNYIISKIFRTKIYVYQREKKGGVG